MVGAAAVVVTLAGCTGSSPVVAPSTPSSASAPAGGVATDPAKAAAYDPVGSAAANQAWFDQQSGTLTAGDLPAPDTVAQALTGAGFDPTTIEASSPSTSTGSAADAVFWAVQVSGECLIGQYSKPTTPGTSASYTSRVTPLLSDGTCLIG